MLQMKPAASGKPGRLRVTCGMLAAGILLLTCLSSFPAGSDACTGFCAGCETTANGSAYVCRSEDFGPDYAKQFVIVPDLFEDDHGFRAPCPAHTLRYSAIMDDPSEYDGIAHVPFGEAGINEKGVSVSATVTTLFNDRVLTADPLTAGGITEMSMASWDPSVCGNSAGRREDPGSVHRYLRAWLSVPGSSGLCGGQHHTDRRPAGDVDL